MKTKATLFLIAALAFLPSLCWSGDAAHSRFFAANHAYTEGRYEEAAAAYEELASRNPVGGGVYYNLGNCYLKMGETGKAILNYERARVLMPRNPDLRFNLGFAQDKRLDQVERDNSFSLAALLDHFTGMELFAAFAVVHLLFCLFVTLRLWRPAEWNFYVMMALGILWLTFGVFAGAKWAAAAHDNRAVVVAKKIDVRAGPAENDTLLFQLHDGSMVDVERQEGGWSLVRFSPEKRGWTQAGGVAAVRPLGPFAGERIEE